jgi:hypothetical protein
MFSYRTSECISYPDTIRPGLGENAEPIFPEFLGQEPIDKVVTTHWPLRGCDFLAYLESAKALVST